MLTDFYASDTNGYKGAVPIDLTSSSVVTSGWSTVTNKPSIWQMYFPTFIPKVLSEVYSTRTPYGKPYTKALDLQTLDQMIHGGYYYDQIAKKIYVKCFNLAEPNSKSICISSQLSIQSRIDSYYIHQNMKLGMGSGVKFTATVGIGEKFVDGANLINSDDFYFSFFIVDPEPRGDILISFPILSPYKLNSVKFPGIYIDYFMNSSVAHTADLVAIPIISVTDGEYRYVRDVNILYRYNDRVNAGDLKPATSSGTGTGTGNGWWVRVYGVNMEQVINEVNTIADLENVGPSSFWYYGLLPDMFKKVRSNNKIYRYVENANVGTIKPTSSNGTGVGANNGWWIETEPTNLGDINSIIVSNTCGFTFKLDSNNTIMFQPLAFQAFTPLIPHASDPNVHTHLEGAVGLEVLQKGSFKIELEIKPRTGSNPILDYTIKIYQILAVNNFSPPNIYEGTINGLPATGNFATYLCGFGMADNVFVDDFIASEIIESV